MKRWNEKEIQYLKEHFNKMHNKELAIYFNVTPTCIQSTLQRYKLIRDTIWTEEKINYLKDNYKKISNQELANHFNVSLLAINSILSRYNISFDENFWTEEKLKELKNKRDSMTNKELASYFNVSISYIGYSCNLHKIYKENGKYKNNKDITYNEVYKVDYLDTPCHECTSHSIGTHGYPEKDSNGRRGIMARYIYEHYTNVIIPNNVHLMHLCDNKLCINPLHLTIGTRQDNINDCVAKGRHARGSVNGHAKLTEEQVKEIRIKNNKGYSNEDLAKEYKVSNSVISEIKTYKSWKHVK